MNIQNFGTDGPIKEEFSLEDIKNRISSNVPVNTPPEMNSMSMLPTIDRTPVAFGEPDKIGQVDYNVDLLENRVFGRRLQKVLQGLDLKQDFTL